MEPITWAILLLLLSLFLIVLELFIPSGGLLGLMAAAAMVASVSVAFSYSLTAGMVMLLTALVLTPTTIFLGFKIWPHTPMGKAILNEHAAINDQTPLDDRTELVGRVGTTKSKMLPSGAIVIDGRTLNAVSTGMPIEANEPVRIVKVSGNSVQVEPHTGPIDPNEASPEAVLEQSMEDLGLDPFEDPLA